MVMTIQQVWPTAKSSGSILTLNTKVRISTIYPAIIFATPVIAQFGQFWLPETPIMGAQPLSVAVQLSMFTFAALAWFRYRSDMQWSPVGRSFWIALIATWIALMGLSIWHGDLFLISSVVVPAIFVMLLLKRPNMADVRLAADVYAWMIVLAAVIAQILDALGIKNLHYEGWNRSWIRIWDAFPFLFEIIDYGRRWEGPFGSVNFAGPIGAFLVVYGLMRRRLTGSLLVASGLVFLFVSDSRSAWFSAVVASIMFLAMLFIYRWNRVRLGRVIGFSALATTTVFILVLAVDRAPAARGLFWEAYLRQWLDYPLTGLGGRGIALLLEQNVLPQTATHGHNILIDPLLRYGILGTLAVASVISLCLLLCVKAPKRVKPEVVALASLFLITGIAEDLVSWTYLSISIVPLMLLGMLADRDGAIDMRRAA